MREFRLCDLVGAGFLGVGDILVYRRTFSIANVTVEKDIMVRVPPTSAVASRDDDKHRFTFR